MHIDDKILERLILSPESLSVKEKDEILVHLDECVYCKESFDTFEKIYCTINEEALKEPTKNDIDLSGRIKTKMEGRDEQKLLTGKSSEVRIYDGKAEIVGKQKIFTLQNIYYFIKNYPLPSLGFALVASLAIAFITVTFKAQFKDKNPVSLDIKNAVLIAYNKEGDVLWKKHTGSINGNERIDSLMSWPAFGQRRYINLLDIDSDGKNEILLAGFGESKIFSSDTLYCLNNDGNLRWKASPENKKFNYAPKWHRTTWFFVDFFTAKVKNGHKLYVIGHVASYGGTIISTLNPANGEVTSSIYHSGYFSCQSHFDIDKDGNDELFLGATSSYDKPAVMILKSDYLMGVMPDFFSSGHQINGNAMYYILLPVSKLGKLLNKELEHVTGIALNVAIIYKFGKNGFSLLTNDYFISINAAMQLQWAFDSTFSCISVTMGSLYQKAYEEYYRKGLLKVPFNEYKKELLDSVKYWDGDKFVNYPARNKYWKQKFVLPSK